MNAIFFDPDMDDATRRQALYDGQLLVYSPRPSFLALCDIAREMSEQAFGARDPRHAQHACRSRSTRAILAELKPKFIHHPKVKALMQAMLRDFGCDPARDVLRRPAAADVDRRRLPDVGHRLRVPPPSRHVVLGARSTRSTGGCPSTTIEPEQRDGVPPRATGTGRSRTGRATTTTPSGTAVSRASAAQHIKSDTRPQPRPEEPVEMDPQVRLICAPGGVILFSGAHLHSTGAEHVRLDPVQHRLPDRPSRTTSGSAAAPPTSTPPAPARRWATTCAIADLAHLPGDLIETYEREPSATTFVAAGMPSEARG